MLAMFEHARLKLRPFEHGDAADVADLHRDPRLRQHLLDDHPLDDPQQAARFVERIQLYYQQHPGLGIWHASVAGRFVGWFSLMPMAEQTGEIELGSRLCTQAWGTGIAMDGCELLLQHAFDNLNAARVLAACHAENRGARLCLLAAGMQLQGPTLYESRPALLHAVEKGHYQRWLAQPRQARLRHAAHVLRGAGLSAAPLRRATPAPHAGTAYAAL